MCKQTIIRAWKDPVFRAKLSPEERSALPPNPAGTIDLNEFEQRDTEGGLITIIVSIPISCLSCWKGTCQTAICTIADPSSGGGVIESGGSGNMVAR